MSPAAPRHPCAVTGCPELVPSGTSRCAAHQAVQGRQLSASRPSVAARGYGAAHRRWRTAILSRDPYCVRCLQHGAIVPAVIADHIVPIRVGGAQYDPANGQGLCQRHGNAKDAARGR